MNSRDLSETEILQEITSLLEQLKTMREHPVKESASPQFYQSLVHHALDIIFVLQPDGTIQYINPAVEAILGYSPSELAGQSFFEYLHGDDRKEVLDHLSQVSSSPGETLPPFKLRMRKKNHTWRILEGTGRNLLHDDLVSGILLNTRDITARVELEQQLQRAQRMEALGLIAGGIAHDFRNLMAVILGSAQMLQMDPSDEDRDKFLEMIIASVNRGKTIAQRILAFAHTGKPSIQKLSGREYLENVQEIAWHTLPDNIDVVVEPFDGDDRIQADPGQLQQVLLGLCTNATDSMPSGGKITLALERPTPELASKHQISAPNDYLCITVSDTGSGMDAETLERIFEPFFTTKEVGNATGLGLSVAYSIMEQHNGWIDAVSEVGKGTTIILGLPRVKEEKRRTAQPPDLKHLPQGQAPHIMVVEDEAHLRELLETILVSKGYKVSVASNGKDALLLYKGKSKDIALIITDLKMPEMDGRELERELHKLKPDLKIIAITGSMGLEKPKIVPNHGFKAVIEKPFDVQEVLSTIQRVLSGAE